MISSSSANDLAPSSIALFERSYVAEPGLHRHTYYQLIFPHQGQLNLRVEGARVAVGPVSWMLVPAGAEHTYWAEGPNYVLVADVAAPAMWGGGEAPRVGQHLIHPRDQRLSALAALLQSELRAGALVEPLIAETLAAYVGAAVSLALNPRLTALPSGAANRLAARARDFVEANAYGPVSLEAVAAAAGASVAHVQRSFRAVHGVSVVEYLQALRVRRAQILLRETDMPVEAVAVAVGFTSPSYFTRLFTRLAGVSPGTFRRGG